MPPFEPYLRVAGDGTYELLVPSAGGVVHVLPYCFHTAEDAAAWLTSRKGREQIGKLRRKSKGTFVQKPYGLGHDGMAA